MQKCITMHSEHDMSGCGVTQCCVTIRNTASSRCAEQKRGNILNASDNVLKRLRWPVSEKGLLAADKRQNKLNQMIHTIPQPERPLRGLVTDDLANAIIFAVEVTTVPTAVEDQAHISHPLKKSEWYKLSLECVEHLVILCIIAISCFGRWQSFFLPYRN